MRVSKIFKTCERVIVFGLDGVGTALREASAPNMKALLENGVLTYEARTVYPPISSQVWTSILYGVPPEKHKISNMSLMAHNARVAAAYPSFFKVARQQLPDCKLASFGDWEELNSGLIEASCQCHLGTFNPPATDQLGRAAADHITMHDPTITFVYFEEPDHVGHEHDYGSHLHHEAIRKCDDQIGIVVNALTDADMLNDSLMIFCTDHGGAYRIHASDLPRDMTVFWGACGPSVAPGGQIQELQTMDTAAVVIHALGLEIPGIWDAKVPQGLYG